MLSARCRERTRSSSLQRSSDRVMRMLVLMLLFVAALEKVFLKHARARFTANEQALVVDARILCGRDSSSSSRTRVLPQAARNIAAGSSAPQRRCKSQRGADGVRLVGAAFVRTAAGRGTGCRIDITSCNDVAFLITIAAAAAAAARVQRPFLIRRA